MLTVSIVASKILIAPADELLKEIEEMAECGMVTELELKIIELSEIHKKLANHFQEMMESFSLDEISVAARDLVSNG